MDNVTTYLLGIVFVVLLPTQGVAQGEGVPGDTLWGGAMLGGGFFEHDGQGADLPQSSRESKHGFTAGAQIDYHLHMRFAVHGEILFAMKGSHDLALGEIRASYTLNYLELPILARVSLPSIKGIYRPFVTVGPMLGFLLSAKGEDAEQGQPLDVDGVWKTVDFGVIFAAGVAVRITPYDLLSLEARYDMGLRAIEHDREAIYNRGMLLVLGYQTCICSRSAAR